MLIILFVLNAFTFTVEKLSWENDIENAISAAKSEEKNILLVFSGSDWCKPCMILEKSVFESSDFEEYADRKLVLLNADFPRKKKNKLSEKQTIKNEILADRYKLESFPLVVLLDSSGKELKRIDRPYQNPKAFIRELDAF